MCQKEKLEIKIGQLWKCKKNGKCIEIINKYKDDWWSVKPKGSKKKIHRMQEHSFHFYELIA